MRQAGRGDIRSVGSGNVGATNVARTVGAGAGFITFLLDAAKGALAVWGAARITDNSVTWMVAAALGAMLGHIFPSALGFPARRTQRVFYRRRRIRTDLPARSDGYKCCSMAVR